jgi:fumarate reductase (CoM/CoB) subunit A
MIDHNPKIIRCHVLIIGGGAAGIRAGLEAIKYGDTIILSKNIVGKDGCSIMAEGGFNAVLNSKDSYAKHFTDTLDAGVSLNIKPQAAMLVKHAPKRLMDLVKWGAVFNSTTNKTLAQRLFGAQQFPRTCYAEDRTGHEIVTTLTGQMRRSPIKVFHNTTVISLLKHQESIAGAIAIDWQGKMTVFLANSTVLATGGGSRIYDITTNSLGSTGDGFALAHKAGAKLFDMEMIQFHPTSAVFPHTIRGCLVTEALRSEGGILYNKLNERFMRHYYPEKMELAPRDILSRSIAYEISAGRGSPHGGVYLDITHLEKKIIEKKLPTMLEQFLKYDIDIRRDPIEVAPATHHIMGGLKITATTGQTTLPNLFACGEVIGGTHGANRLGGNSLAETQVFGRLAGIAAGKNTKRIIKINHDQITKQIKRLNTFFSGNVNPTKVADTIKKIMWQNVGIFRNADGLNKTLSTLQKLSDLKLKATTPHNLVECCTVQNMCYIAILICKSALLRPESCGAHFRTDCKKNINKKCCTYHIYV